MIKQIFLIFTLLILSGCVKEYRSHDSIEMTEKQYLDEIPVPDSYEKNYDAELRKLHEPDDSEYKINIGDRFNIYVYDENDLNTEGAYVKQDGTLSIKLAGEIKVEKKTIREAAKAIEEKFKQYLKYPQVSLVPSELSGTKFTIVGKVNKPGTFPIEKTYLVDAVAIAGGFTVGIFQNNTVEMADLEHSFISRKGKILPVDFAKAIRKGDKLHNIPLRDGDYIYIPSSMNKEVIVLGEVNSPGYVGFKEALTLIQAVSYARGFKVTASSQALVLRGKLSHPRVYSVDTQKILNGEMRDFRLAPDDIIYIPNTVLGKWNNIVRQVIPSLDAALKTKSLIQ